MFLLEMLTLPFDRLARGGLLHPVEFGQVKQVALDETPVGQPTVLQDTSTELLHAILGTFRTTKKHDAESATGWTLDRKAARPPGPTPAK